MNLQKLIGDPEITGYSLSMKRCANIQGLPAVIRGVFNSVIENGYFIVGEYFADMSDYDIDLLSELAEKIYPENAGYYSSDAKEDALTLLTLFGLGMASGEGLELTDECNDTYIKTAIILITLESLSRKGLVQVYHENWSLGSDNERPIASKI